LHTAAVHVAKQYLSVLAMSAGNSAIDFESVLKTNYQLWKQETQLKLAVADRTKPEVEIWRRPKK